MRKTMWALKYLPTEKHSLGKSLIMPYHYAATERQDKHDKITQAPYVTNKKRHLSTSSRLLDIQTHLVDPLQELNVEADPRIPWTNWICDQISLLNNKERKHKQVVITFVAFLWSIWIYSIQALFRVIEGTPSSYRKYCKLISKDYQTYMAYQSLIQVRYQETYE